MPFAALDSSRDVWMHQVFGFPVKLVDTHPKDPTFKDIRFAIEVRIDPVSSCFTIDHLALSNELIHRPSLPFRPGYARRCLPPRLPPNSLSRTPVAAQ